MDNKDHLVWKVMTNTEEDQEEILHHLPKIIDRWYNKVTGKYCILVETEEEILKYLQNIMSMEYKKDEVWVPY
jgi:hypothetical protein